MTVTVRIERKPASWRITVTPDQANVIAFEASNIYIDMVSGRFMMNARAADGTHLDVMADIIIGPEDTQDYAMIVLEGFE